MLNNSRSLKGDDELQNLFRAALEQRRGSTSHAQGKRTQKNTQSGKSGRKAYHSQQALRAVGGFNSTMAAIHASNTIWVKNPIYKPGQFVAPEYIEVPRPMCVVREPTTTTWALGGSMSPRHMGGRGV